MRSCRSWRSILDEPRNKNRRHDFVKKVILSGGDLDKKGKNGLEGYFPLFVTPESPVWRGFPLPLYYRAHG